MPIWPQQQRGPKYFSPTSLATSTDIAPFCRFHFASSRSTMRCLTFCLRSTGGSSIRAKPAIHLPPGTYDDTRLISIVHGYHRNSVQHGRQKARQMPLTCTSRLNHETIRRIQLSIKRVWQIRREITKSKDKKGSYLRAICLSIYNAVFGVTERHSSFKSCRGEGSITNNQTSNDLQNETDPSAKPLFGSRCRPGLTILNKLWRWSE